MHAAHMLFMPAPSCLQAAPAPAPPQQLGGQGEPFDPGGAASSSLLPSSSDRRASLESARMATLPPGRLARDSLQSAVAQHIVLRSSAPAGMASAASSHPNSAQGPSPFYSAPPGQLAAGMQPVYEEGGLGGGVMAVGLGVLDQLVRAVECFKEGAALVDMSTPSWHIRHVNAAFGVASGGCGGGAGRVWRGLGCWAGQAAREAGLSGCAGYAGCYLAAGALGRHKPAACPAVPTTLPANLW